MTPRNKIGSMRSGKPLLYMILFYVHAGNAWHYGPAALVLNFVFIHDSVVNWN